MRRFLFWSLCFCLLFPVGLSSCDGSDSAAVIFGGTTGKLTWTLTEDGVLTITGEGPMPDYRDGGTSETPPWYPHVNRISSLTIGEGVTRIGDYAFMLCSFVTKVVIPESVTSMGDWAFWHCQSLKRITFPDRMVRFGEWAFYENESLQSVCIPEGVTTIPSSAFARCHNLTCVIMPGSLWGCSALITVSFEHESQLKIIQGSYEKIYVGHSPNGYNRYYRSGGFRGLANLTTFDASNCSQIESIEPSAFYHCSKLQSVKVGTMIPPTCGIDAFSELNSYTILTVPKESIEAYKQANEWKNFTNITALN